MVMIRISPSAWLGVGQGQDETFAQDIATCGLVRSLESTLGLAAPADANFADWPAHQLCSIYDILVVQMVILLLLQRLSST